MGGRTLRAGALGLALAVLVPAVARADSTAPELFVSEGDTSSLQSSPPVWQPIATARLTGAYSYRLGVRLQPSADSLKRQYVIVQAFTSPQTPERGSAVIPPVGSCKEVRGTEGEIAEFGLVRYYGDGQYSLTVAAAPYAAGPCPTTGPASSGAFTVDARPALSFEGEPRSRDRRPAGPFRGLRFVGTMDSVLPQAVCALDPVVQPDGSLRGSIVTRATGDLVQPDGTLGFAEIDAFPHAGNWSCVGRIRGGPDNVASGWSTPVSAVLPGDFAVYDFLVTDESFPSYRVRFQVDRGAAGGTVSFRLRTCPKYSKGPSGKTLKPKILKISAPVDERGRAIFRFRRKVPDMQFGRYFVGKARFSGTALVAKATSLTTFSFGEITDSFRGRLLDVNSPSGC